MKPDFRERARVKARAQVASNVPIVKALFAAIDASGLTMDHLSKKSGVHWRTIQNWRTAATGISLVYLEAVAGAVDLELTLQQKEPKA